MNKILPIAMIIGGTGVAGYFGMGWAVITYTGATFEHRARDLEFLWGVAAISGVASVVGGIVILVK